MQENDGIVRDHSGRLQSGRDHWQFKKGTKNNTGNNRPLNLTPAPITDRVLEAVVRGVPAFFRTLLNE